MAREEEEERTQGKIENNEEEEEEEVDDKVEKEAAKDEKKEGKEEEEEREGREKNLLSLSLAFFIFLCWTSLSSTREKRACNQASKRLARRKSDVKERGEKTTKERKKTEEHSLLV